MGGSGSCRREGRLTDHLEVESESGTIGKHPRRSARAKWREKEDTAEMHQPHSDSDWFTTVRNWFSPVRLAFGSSARFSTFRWFLFLFYNDDEIII